MFCNLDDDKKDLTNICMSDLLKYEKNSNSNKSQKQGPVINPKAQIIQKLREISEPEVKSQARIFVKKKFTEASTNLTKRENFKN